MAFNPFRRMRKHQKAIMAALVLLSMVTFVLMGSNFGGGDFFSDISRTFTGSVQASDVASLYGKTISQQQLQKLQKQRFIANNYMLLACEAAKKVREDQIRKTLGTNPQAAMALRMRLQQDPQFMELDQKTFFGVRFGIPYFGGGMDSEGLLDFLIWKHQADRLGINLTPGDVQREFHRLTYNLLGERKDLDEIEFKLRQAPEFRAFWSDGIVLTALTDEFRVRMAQNALTGYEPGSIDKVAAPVTPAEFWNFYKDNRTDVEVALLPVRVEDFVAKVKEKPTEEELKALYGKYKDRDYHPESPEPGFKKPHRIRVEWVSANADSPYYKQLAADSVPLVETLQQVLSAGTTPAPLAGPAAIGANLALARAVDTRLIRKYDERKWLHYRNASWTDYWLDPYPMHLSSFRQPADVAALVGQSLGWAGTSAAPLAAVTAAESLAARREIRDRTIFGITVALFKPLPLGGAALVVYGTPKDEFVPLRKVKAEVLEKLSADQTRTIRDYALEQVKSEIDKLAKKDKKDKKAVAKYVAEAIKKYHLQTGQTTELRDEHKNKIADDPGLAPFKTAYLEPPSADPTGKDFGKQFFPQPRFQGQKPWETYSPEQWSNLRQTRNADNVFLFWKTEDQPGKVMPLTDPETRQAVEQAWRFQKARELAQKDADQLAQQVREEKGDLRKLKDLAERQKKTLIELMPMARQNRSPSVGGESAYQYHGPRIPEDRVPHIQATQSTFAERVVGLRDKQPGDTLVLPDQPQSTYYVAVLLKKLEPSATEFYYVYQNSSSNAARKDPLLAQFERERQEKYRQEYMERLRVDAKLNIHRENAKKWIDQGGGE